MLEVPHSDQLETYKKPRVLTKEKVGKFLHSKGAYTKFFVPQLFPVVEESIFEFFGNVFLRKSWK